MTDWSTMHRFENSPENVAFKLMHEIAKVERKALDCHRGRCATTADRQWILDTYSECLEAVRGQRAFRRKVSDKKDAVSYTNGAQHACAMNRQAAEGSLPVRRTEP